MVMAPDASAQAKKARSSAHARASCTDVPSRAPSSSTPLLSAATVEPDEDVLRGIGGRALRGCARNQERSMLRATGAWTLGSVVVMCFRISSSANLGVYSYCHVQPLQLLLYEDKVYHLLAPLLNHLEYSMSLLFCVI